MTISASARDRARAILRGLDYDPNDELIEYADAQVREWLGSE